MRKTKAEKLVRFQWLALDFHLFVCISPCSEMKSSSSKLCRNICWIPSLWPMTLVPHLATLGLKSQPGPATFILRSGPLSVFLGLNHGMSPGFKRQSLVNPRSLGAWSLAHNPWPLVPGAWSLGLRLLVPGFGCLSRFLSLCSGFSGPLGFRWALEEIGGVVDAGQDVFFMTYFQPGPKT